MTCCLFLLLAALPCVGQDRAPAPADQAKAAAEAFMKGFQLLNLDDILKTVDVPWFHDGKTVIYETKELEADFGKLLERYRGTPKVKYELTKQHAYGAARDKLEPSKRKLVDEVLTEKDFLQVVQLTNPDTGKKETVILFVRVKDGKAKVVGLEN